ELPPGDYVLHGAVLGAAQGILGNGCPVEEHALEQLALREGETAHVRLLLEAAAKVRLHGRVLAGGAPTTDAFVSADSEDDSGFHVFAEVRDGTYSLELPGSGRYSLAAVLDSLSWRTS